MKNILTVVIAIAMLTLAGGVTVAQSGNDLFQQALVKERTEGNLNEAIKLYQTIVQKYSSDRKLAAKALFQMGQAYEKLGNTEARKAYERIARDFADQKEVAADAGKRLAALSVPPPSDKPTQRLVMSGDGVDSLASISPDGRWMVLPDRETRDIAVRDMSTGQSVRLKAKAGSTKDGGGAESVAFSPDMSQLAYTWFTGDKGTAYQLRVMPNAVGGKSRTLVNKAEFDFWSAVWFPDGKSILATVEKPDQTWQLLRVFVSDGSIKVIKSLEWRFRPLPGSFRPSISPDGQFIAYSAFANNPSGPFKAPDSKSQYIYLLVADGSGPETELVKTASISEAPLWTPDGARVLYTTNLSGKFDLWSIPVANGRASAPPALVRRDIGEISPIGITRSGSYYYVQTQTGIEQVSIAELAPRSGSRIVESFVGFNPSWSPDGKSVAFKRHSTQFRDFYDVVVRSLVAGEERVFSRNGLRGDPPRWLPDNTGFLTLVGIDASTSASWHRVDLKTGEFTQPGQLGSIRQGVVAVDRDGKTLYVSARDLESKSNAWDRIVAVDFMTGQERRVFMFTGAVENRPQAGGISIAISPDGRTLAMATTNTKTRETHIALVDTNGNNYLELGSTYRGNGTPLTDKLAWTKDGRSLLFARADENPNSSLEIMRIAIEGGTPEFTGLRVNGLSTFDLSPDGSRIALSTTAGASPAELLAIDNLLLPLKDTK